MNSGDVSNHQNDCPRRRWVLAQLSDDEARDEHGQLPQWLTFHISQCSSCRALAQQLESLTDELSTVASLEANTSLEQRARQQTLEALRDGAKLTGRFEIPDDDEYAVLSPMSPTWTLFRQYAMAASIALLLIGGSWFARHNWGGPVADPTAAVEDGAAVYPHERRLPVSEVAPESQSVEVLADRQGASHEQDHLEASLSEASSGAQPAFLLPDPAERGFDLSQRSPGSLFIDTQAEERSTSPGPETQTP